MHRFEYYLVVLLFWIFKRVNFRTGKIFALALYLIVAKMVRYRRQVILSNLAHVYGGHWPLPQKYLLKQIYKNFVFLWMEFLQITKLDSAALENHFRIHNIEVLEEAFQAQKGVILLSGHFGNFEWLGQMHALLGYKLSGIAKRQRNVRVNTLIEKNRQKNSVGVIYTNTAMKDGLELLKRNEILAIVADQDARARGVFIDFLGIPSSTAVGPAIFHLRTGAPIVFIISIRRDYGQFDIYYEKIRAASPAQEVTDEKIRLITQQHAQVLDKWVRKFPEQWFWMHRRWKTKPPEQVTNRIH